MTLRALVGSALLAALAAVAPALADNVNGTVRVSARVVRSCRVTSDQPQVSVTCGARSQPMQVTYAGPGVGQGAQRTVTPETAHTVTIHF